ncbi:Senecionine N-oxygenase [Mycoemilia scoparia]|uniref:glutaminase n=1 Tax=Mycoemilia scoparia TaxID=417184 RepID=A0A9W8DVU8_9FUNG|nr:Senecionine N-oxygenase [Mycoemilia scoparia]
MTISIDSRPLNIGVLALQGAFSEHVIVLNKLANTENISKVIEVRTKEQLGSIDALIIPGGESTTMALIAERSGLIEPLREFVKTKPTWGTCAGLILLSHKATNTKKNGQELLGVLPVTVSRNKFGRQVDSFTISLPSPCLDAVTESGNSNSFPYVFIRAPCIIGIDDPLVQELIVLPTSSPAEEKGDIVAVKYKHLLGTSFHPELTNDNRWHQYFINMARENI